MSDDNEYKFTVYYSENTSFRLLEEEMCAETSGHKKSEIELNASVEELNKTIEKLQIKVERVQQENSELSVKNDSLQAQILEKDSEIKNARYY